ncbi:flavodoxin domain-containing protein [Sphaerisporangium dianthi]|uniref:Flavodoxin domain-containing protein n=2 Tax=Sphaerisporangium dianthi TaxID=1436120 RepID=A0ABV9CWA6_9ACTN
MARILVAHGSKRGSTAQIAEWIGEVLRDDGHEVDVLPADKARQVLGYDAVILGGSLYAGRWHAASRRFARRHAKTLEACSVWLFSSGPLDHSAVDHDIAPVAQVAGVMASVDALGHKTFGGRLLERPRGFVASMLAKSKAGDYRDRELVRAWAKEVSSQLDRPADRGDGGAERTGT